MIRITDLPREEVEAQLKLRTYYAYVKTYLLALQQCLSTTSEHMLIRRALTAQKKLPRFQRLQGGAKLADELEDQLSQSYARGSLTLSAMSNLPVITQPGLVLAANLWLPVQAYYALHGMGQAALIALNGTAPSNHRSFRAAFADFRDLFPWPLSVGVAGGPERHDLVLSELNVEVEQICNASNLSNPATLNPELLLGKCLCTTREKIIEEKLNKERKKNVHPGRRYRRLSKQTKAESCASIHQTTVADFLYRIRVKSNYDDPEMYIYGQSDLDEAVEHYQNLCTLTTILVECSKAIVRRRIGSGKEHSLQRRLRND